MIAIFLGLWENIKGQEKECVFFKMLDYLLPLLKEVETPDRVGKRGEGRGLGQLISVNQIWLIHLEDEHTAVNDPLLGIFKDLYVLPTHFMP